MHVSFLYKGEVHPIVEIFWLIYYFIYYIDTNFNLYILGTRSFMAKNKKLIKDCEGAELITCNKHTIGKRRLQKLIQRHLYCCYSTWSYWILATFAQVREFLILNNIKLLDLQEFDDFEHISNQQFCIMCTLMIKVGEKGYWNCICVNNNNAHSTGTVQYVHTGRVFFLCAHLCEVTFLTQLIAFEIWVTNPSIYDNHCMVI
jgi:hypothetical protein